MIEIGIVTSQTATHIHLPADRCDDGTRCGAVFGEVSMTDAEYSRKLDELDQLLNDPDVPMEPDRIWSILADVSRRHLPQAGRAGLSDGSAGAVSHPV